MNLWLCLSQELYKNILTVLMGQSPVRAHLFSTFLLLVSKTTDQQTRWLLLRGTQWMAPKGIGSVSNEHGRPELTSSRETGASLPHPSEAAVLPKRDGLRVVRD